LIWTRESERERKEEGDDEDEEGRETRMGVGTRLVCTKTGDNAGLISDTCIREGKGRVGFIKVVRWRRCAGC
jgi:hypothetical protein